VLPYLLVLIGGVVGINVFVVLLAGIVSGAAIMIATGAIVPAAGQTVLTQLLANVGGNMSGMFETCMVAILVAALCELIRENGNRMTTGFVGTPYILHVLSDHGYTDVAYSLLFQEENPSWLYSVTHGATTMWEHWNSLKEDGSFWSTAMNSFNHYAYGAVYDWIFGVSSGIMPTENAPAYKEITLAPHPSKALGFADASIDSRNGMIRSYWYYKGDVVYYEFEIPAGVTAYVTLPSGRKETLTDGKFCFAE
jgi:alpha-L-rhamnosidase